MKHFWGWTAAGAALLAAYCWWGEPRRLSITRQEVTDTARRLKSPLRVLLLTDWHLGRFSRPDVLEVKMRRLQQRHAQEPFDLVLLGGDYVDTEPKHLALLAPCLETLASFSVPVYAVLGNHDYTSFGGDAGPVQAFLERGGVRVLRNEAAAVVAAGGQRLLVVGLDDLQESSEYYDPARYQPPAHYKDAAARMDWYAQFDALEPDTPRLLLAHNPDAVYLPGRTPLAVLCRAYARRANHAAGLGQPAPAPLDSSPFAARQRRHLGRAAHGGRPDASGQPGNGRVRRPLAPAAPAGSRRLSFALTTIRFLWIITPNHFPAGNTHFD